MTKEEKKKLKKDMIKAFKKMKAKNIISFSFEKEVIEVTTRYKPPEFIERFTVLTLTYKT